MLKFTPKEIQKLENILGVKENPGPYEKKLWEKVAQYTPLFAKIPGILTVCVCNSLTMNAAHKNSDIDLFIITKRNRIWTVRLLTTLLLALKGERKTSKKHAGKFCLSFFISEEGMDFEKISLRNDIYLSYWIQTLRPIINRNKMFEKFKFENGFGEKPEKSMSENIILKNPKIYTLFGDICEKIIKSLILPKTKKSFQKLGKPFGVIIKNDMLKFHDNDRRKELRDAIFS